MTERNWIREESGKIERRGKENKEKTEN